MTRSTYLSDCGLCTSLPVYKCPVFQQSSPKLNLILNINILESSPCASPSSHLLHKPLRVVSSNTRDFYFFKVLATSLLLVQVVLSRPVEALTEQNTPKGKKGQTDEALIASSSSYHQNNNNANKCHKGKCHHCSREGHWVWECHTKQKEEVAATSSNQNGQIAQVTSGSSKSENRPVGSANAIFNDNSDSDGFCAAKEEGTITHAICTDPNPYLDDLDLDNDWDNIYTEVESIGDQSDKLESLGECPDKLDNKGEDPNKLDNEGEDLNIEETTVAVITLIDADGTPCTEVYDLGSLHHISPYKDNFMLYMPLSTPLYFNAASQHKFPAIGTGTLVVCMPVTFHRLIFLFYAYQSFPIT